VIDLTTGDSLTRPVMLAKSTTTKCAEGPHLIKWDGWYYLLMAEGGTAECHPARISRSKSPLGPYEYPEDPSVNPLLFNWMHPTVRNTGTPTLSKIFRVTGGLFFLAVRAMADGGAPLGSGSAHELVGAWPVED